ncbi:MAG: hypothetical protein WAN36_11265, partial [Calditrichia bacterium]
MRRKIKTSLATKFALTITGLIFFTLLVVSVAIYRTIVTQFTAQYQKNVRTAEHMVRSALWNQKRAILEQLRGVTYKLSEDDDFVIYTGVLKQYNNKYITDYAAAFLPTMGLEILEIIRKDGRMISSGHSPDKWRGQHTRMAQFYKHTRNTVLIGQFDGPRGSDYCLLAMDSTRLQTQQLYVMGGVAIDSGFLQDMLPDTSILAFLLLPHQVIASTSKWQAPEVLKDVSLKMDPEQLKKELVSDYSVGGFDIPMINESGIIPVHVLLLHPKTALNELLSSLSKR